MFSVTYKRAAWRIIIDVAIFYIRCLHLKPERLFAPGDVGLPGGVVEGAAEDEEVVAQAVYESRHEGMHRSTCGLQGGDVSLGAAAYGACHVGLCCGHGSAGKDERT